MKKLEFIGNSDLKLIIRFNEVQNGDDPREYYNITIIHDSLSVGGVSKEVSGVHLVPKEQIVEQLIKFIKG